jgi:hypothetical protein
LKRHIFRNFGIEGNHKLNSWGISFTSQTSFDRAYPRGLVIGSSNDVLFYNLRSDETMNDAFVIQTGSFDCAMKSVFSRLVTPVRQYLQWTFGLADSDYCMLLDCEVDSDWMTSGFECFRSSVSMMIRFTGRNAAMSTNTSGAFYFDSPNVTIEAGSQYNYDPSMSSLNQNWHPLRELMSVNTNIGNTSGQGADLATNGGLIRNFDLTMEGYLDATYQTRAPCIIASPTYIGVGVIGGRIEYPVKGTGLQTYGVACDGDAVTVSGVRFIGFSNAADYSVFARYAGTLGHGRAVGCIGENIQARVAQRNMTNAEYIAAGGS